MGLAASMNYARGCFGSLDQDGEGEPDSSELGGGWEGEEGRGRAGRLMEGLGHPHYGF